MQDFTLTTYKKLLQELLANGYSFQTLQDFIQQPIEKAIILRHDVDRLPENALKMAHLENDEGVKASYYFRTVPSVFKIKIISDIASLDHEIGYHYEDLSMCKGNMDRAIMNFKSNLARMRKLVPVSTICMHGSPLSSIDNLDLWKKYNYKDLSIIAEPYIDIDYTQVFYVTDTGRKWNIKSSSVRDKVDSGFHILIESTQHFIELAEKNELPAKIMLNVHPHRWFDYGVGWVKELVGQNVKNIAKTAIIGLRK